MHVAAAVNHSAGHYQTLLATALVHILSSTGQCTSVRVLLDPGTELFFVREFLAQLLRVPHQRANIPIIGIGSRFVGSTRGVLSIRLRSCVTPSVELNVLAYILSQLTGRLHSIQINTTR